MHTLLDIPLPVDSTQRTSYTLIASLVIDHEDTFMKQSNVILLVLISTLLLSIPINRLRTVVIASSVMWTVDDDGPADFNRIQEAIDAANEGDSIFVFNGIYPEHLHINKSICLIGQDRNLTVLDGSGTWGDVISVRGNNVQICGFTIRNGEIHYSGIALENCVGANISLNIVMDSDYGINILESRGCLVSENCIFSNKYNGVTLRYSFSNQIFDNNISSNFNAGIAILECQSNKLFGNTISNNRCGFYAYSSRFNSIFHNGFFKNNVQVESDGFENDWDDGYPSAGNFWSDHNPPDSDRDRIGDSAYVVDIGFFDRYPLIYPPDFVPVPDVNGDGIVNIAIDVSIAVKAFGSIPGDCRWKPETDMDLNERINMIDIAKIARAIA